jgi:SRSO17 transposase
LSYVSSRGQVLLDRRLYLPEEWAEDSARRARAKVPVGVVFQTKPQQASEMLQHAWSNRRWQRLTVTEGSQGLRTYDWADQRIIESRDGLPGEEVWLIARRSLTDPTDLAYFLSNASLETDLERLAQVAAARATIEQALQTAKGETGLDQYEVRYWHSWHRHITLAMMAQAWLAAVRSRTTAKKRACALPGRVDGARGTPPP